MAYHLFAGAAPDQPTTPELHSINNPKDPLNDLRPPTYCCRPGTIKKHPRALCWFGFPAQKRIHRRATDLSQVEDGGCDSISSYLGRYENCPQTVRAAGGRWRRTLKWQAYLKKSAEAGYLVSQTIKILHARSARSLSGVPRGLRVSGRGLASGDYTSFRRSRALRERRGCCLPQWPTMPFEVILANGRRYAAGKDVIKAAEGGVVCSTGSPWKTSGQRPRMTFVCQRVSMKACLINQPAAPKC